MFESCMLIDFSQENTWTLVSMNEPIKINDIIQYIYFLTVVTENENN